MPAARLCRGLLENEQLGGADFERTGDGKDVLEGWVANATLNARQIGDMHVGAVRYLFLGRA